MVGQTHDLPMMMRTWRPAGVLAFIYVDEMPYLLKGLGIPVVSFANTDNSLPLPMVGVDDRATGRMAAEHLLERGFQHFAFVGCPRFAYSNQREVGYGEALAEVGFACQSHHDPHAPDVASVWAWAAEPRLQQFLLQLPRPCGVFADRRPTRHLAEPSRASPLALRARGSVPGPAHRGVWPEYGR